MLQLRMRKSEPRFTSELMTGSSRADTLEFKARPGTASKQFQIEIKHFGFSLNCLGSVKDRC